MNPELKLALQKSAAYGIIGPAVCGFVLAQLTFFVLWSHKPEGLGITEYFTVTAITIACSYVLGFFPAIVAGLVVSSRTSKIKSKRSLMMVFWIGFFATITTVMAMTSSFLMSGVHELFPLILVYVIIGLFGGATASFIILVERKMANMVRYLRNRNAK